ncbi:MAG TPA: hypothetical protein VFZ61_07930 [Polyangiales bacterium]
MAMFVATLCTTRAARAQSDGDSLYLAPGLVYSALDANYGRHAIGAELSLPWARGLFAVGPFVQAQWTPGGAHYVLGGEVVFSYFAVELGWFGHGAATHGRNGLSATALVGIGVIWLGARWSTSIEGDMSVALNLSLKVPFALKGQNMVCDVLHLRNC